MKKLISIIIVLVIISTISINVISCEEYTNDNIIYLVVDNVHYDDISKMYILTLKDSDNENWVIESKTNINLNSWVMAIYDDMNTEYLYDDEIINWHLVED